MREGIISDKKKFKVWHLKEWRSGNDDVDGAVYRLFYGLDKNTRKRAHHRLIEIGEVAVPTILNALIELNATSAGFGFFAGGCERNILPLRTLEAIGSPLAFSVLCKIYKLARREKMSRSEVPEHRVLCIVLRDALRKCDHRWWKSNPKEAKTGYEKWKKAHPGETEAAYERWLKESMEARVIKEVYK